MSSSAVEGGGAQQQQKKGGGGICAIKPEFIRELQQQGDGAGRSAPPTTAAAGSSSAEGEQGANRERGMNKGAAREFTKFERSGERPTFEGEVNFLNSDVIDRVKPIVRSKGQAAVPSPSSTSAAPALSADVMGNSKRPREETVDGGAVDDEKAAAARAARKEAAAAQTEPPKFSDGITSEEQKRENAARRDELFRHRLVQAPLTTVGNLPFRRICKEFGADNTMSEMAMVYNLNKTQKSEWSLLRRHSSEGVFGLQLAVSRPADALTFAKALQASEFSYDYIDINCGCPVDLITRNGCGCGLWEKKGKLREITQILCKYQPRPVTIKCRVGADETDPTLHRQIGEYESWGASAVTIHGRSKRQRYTKLANWNYIEQCAKLTNLPTIGNGDIMSHHDFVAHLEECPTVTSHMIGRGCLIKPWVFEEIKNRQVKDISSHERFEMLKRFCGYGLAHYGADEKGVQMTRRFLCEWLSFLYRYVPVGIMERLPQRINERPPPYNGRDDLETLMASDNAADWIKISEMLLGPAGAFKFTPKHKSNSYAQPPSASSGAAAATTTAADDGADEG